jgi:hypothetical protein
VQARIPKCRYESLLDVQVRGGLTIQAALLCAPDAHASIGAVDDLDQELPPRDLRGSAGRLGSMD